MKHASHNPSDEYFVLKMDGHLKSTHRRFIDALKAALELKNQFPTHDVKVRAATEQGSSLH